jgi:uncharacterized membrane protein
MVTSSNVLLICTATATALMAGLFFSWSYSVMPGLAQLPDREFIASMQAMNQAIQNSIFFSAFFGAAILLPISTYVQYSQASVMCFRFLLLATLVYWLGIMCVTIVGNVPLNETLESFQLDRASPMEIATQRANFESPWNFLNGIRTFASSVSIILVVLACLSSKIK